MAPLPATLAPDAPLVAWRVDTAAFATSWDSGLGAERFGGRWNPVGLKAVYCAIDPSTCIIEVAVHKGFAVLDTQPHVITGMTVLDATDVRVVHLDDVPNLAWLHGGIPSAGQQAFGAALLSAHDFVIFPSAVSKLSWNLLFDPQRAAGKYERRVAQRLVVDTRLNLS